MKTVVQCVVASLGLAVAGCGGALDEKLDTAGSEELATQEQPVYTFQLGIQASDNGTNIPGGEQFTGEIYNPGAGQNWSSASDWAVDGDAPAPTVEDDDPDAVRVGIRNAYGLLSSDFRVGIQVFDWNESVPQAAQWTPWVTELNSMAPGWSGLAVDSDAYDPNRFRILVETRPWNSGKTLRDFRLHLKMSDRCDWFWCGWEEGNSVQTPWAVGGGGWSEWALPRGGWDPNGIAIGLEASFQ